MSVRGVPALRSRWRQPPAGSAPPSSGRPARCIVACPDGERRPESLGVERGQQRRRGPGWPSPARSPRLPPAPRPAWPRRPPARADLEVQPHPRRPGQVADVGGQAVGDVDHGGGPGRPGRHPLGPGPGPPVGHADRRAGRRPAAGGAGAGRRPRPRAAGHEQVVAGPGAPAGSAEPVVGVVGTARWPSPRPPAGSSTTGRRRPPRQPPRPRPRPPRRQALDRARPGRPRTPGRGTGRTPWPRGRDTAAIRAFQPRSSGVPRAGRRGRPPTTRSVASTSGPAGRVTTAASSPIPRSPGPERPAAASNRARRASMSVEFVVSGRHPALRAPGSVDGRIWVCAPDLPTIVPGPIPVQLTGRAEDIMRTRCHVDGGPEGRRTTEEEEPAHAPHREQEADRLGRRGGRPHQARPRSSGATARPRSTTGSASCWWTTAPSPSCPRPSGPTATGPTRTPATWPGSRTAPSSARPTRPTPGRPTTGGTRPRCGAS